MAAWVLPDHIADVLPSEARHIEELRRLCLDTARSFGYELVMPPMLEHVASLLPGANTDLDVQTFKMIDQLSGRTLGLRIDTTPQVARIDAHLLNRVGVTRLCYCGPVLHTKPLGPYATREPLQLGAEIYGHAGLEADLEILQLALHSLRASQLASFHIDLSDARILPALLQGQSLSADQTKAIADALTHKDISAMRGLTAQLPLALGQALQALPLGGGSLSWAKASLISLETVSILSFTSTPNSVSCSSVKLHSGPSLHAGAGREICTINVRITMRRYHAEFA
jgi:ATP phosphoribosyltransferase regulatory subunit